MTQKRQLRLGAFMRPVSLHTGAWRYPGAFPDANFNFGHLKHFAQRLEPPSSMRSSWRIIWPCSTCPLKR